MLRNRNPVSYNEEVDSKKFMTKKNRRESSDDERAIQAPQDETSQKDAKELLKNPEELEDLDIK